MPTRTMIAVPREKLAAFCLKHHVREPFFGSVLREDFSSASDVDVLAEFEAGHTPGLEFFAMESELSSILGRKVDLNTLQFLNRHIRADVLAEAEVQYVAS